MKARDGIKILFSVAVLAPLLWGCRDSLLEPERSWQEADSVPVSIVLGKEGNGQSRTIAPGHVPVSDLANPARYKLVLTGSSDMGTSVVMDPFVIGNDGMGGLDLSPGAWDLTVTVTEVATSKEILRGHYFVIIVDYHVRIFIELLPITDTTGSVAVEFTLPQAVVQGLNPAGNGTKTVTVALYDVAGTQPVQGTSQTFTVSAAAAAGQFTYRNGSVPAGQYTVRMTAPFTGANNVQKTLGWQDILHVEGNRESVHSVSLPGTALGRPSGNPGKRDKAGSSVTVESSNGTSGSGTNNITGSQSFPRYGDGLWIYGSNWDGGTDRQDVGTGGRSGSTQGNEVLLVAWDSVYNADYYELEMLLHPSYGQYDLGREQVYNSAKYEKLPVSDTDWEQFKGRTPAPLQLAFSGDNASGNYYKRKVHTHQILTSSTAKVGFDFLAWRDLANGRNSNYAVASAARAGSQGAFIGAPNLATGLSTRNGVSYRIGLEGSCNALAVLVNSYSPQHWYGIRVRAVNEFGYSDWVYWKGGKN